VLVGLTQRVLSGSIEKLASLFALVLCDHLFAAAAVSRDAMAGEKRKGLGGDTKSRKGSSSWEAFIKSNPDRVKR
jgi:hypothetical protein